MTCLITLPMSRCDSAPVSATAVSTRLSSSWSDSSGEVGLDDLRLEVLGVGEVLPGRLPVGLSGLAAALTLPPQYRQLVA